MGNLSKNFLRDEFKCKCGKCNFDTVDAELIKVLQDLHESMANIWGAPVKITINSGCRCKEHNTAIGGSENSQHLLGKAADIQVFFRDPQKKWVKIKPLSICTNLKISHSDTYGIGNYVSFTHIDVRPERARW